MFEKYKSIENHYREKTIRDMLNFHPEYHNCIYIAQEKIDGANFQIKFKKNDGAASISISYGKRTSMLGADEKFETFQHIVAQDHIQSLQEEICTFMYAADIDELILYGELYGKGIQRRINYLDHKDLIFYDVKIDGKYISPKVFYAFMSWWNADKLAVPMVADFDSIEEALDFEVENHMTVVGVQEEGNNWEGVVIKPYEVIAEDDKGRQVLFYTKKKSVEFGDKMKVKKNKAPKEVPQALQDAWDVYSAYLNDNRVKDVLGKHGMIEDHNQIGQYIKFVMEDAKEDFLKDNMDMFNALGPKEKGKVFSITGKIVSKLLFKYI